MLGRKGSGSQGMGRHRRPSAMQRAAGLLATALGPTLPTWALQQVGSYPGYTGRDANVVAKAAFGPRLPVGHICFTVGFGGQPDEAWMQRKRRRDAKKTARMGDVHSTRSLPGRCDRPTERPDTVWRLCPLANCSRGG